jgi:hypothetical protein
VRSKPRFGDSRVVYVLYKWYIRSLIGLNRRYCENGGDSSDSIKTEDILKICGNTVV